MLVDRCILLDVGESEFLERNPDVVFITHLHPDHTFFVTQKVDSIDVPVCAPEQSENIEIQVISGEVSIGSYTITAIPTIHSKAVESTAYLLERDNRLLYTRAWFGLKKSTTISSVI
ncbi:MAG: hypothetical protein ACOC38_06825 [Promethearchaeia archaeon]